MAQYRARLWLVGDGYVMCHSYINASTQGILNCALLAQTRTNPAAIFCAAAKMLNEWLASEAVADADLVVTDVWSSMGHDGKKPLAAKHEPYQVNEALLDLQPGAVYALFACSPWRSQRNTIRRPTLGCVA